jgi:peptidoglycan hydrolase-like protein with peptidoglycan-binding domain
MLALFVATGIVQAMETTADMSEMKKDEAMIMKEETMAAPANNLMHGSYGDEVVVLQTFLETYNFLIIPTGVKKGYFGPLTQSALMKYQASVGVFSTGYYGPLTRGALSASIMTKNDVMMKEDTVMKKDSGEMKEDTTMKKM